MASKKGYKRPDDMVVYLLPDGTEVSNDPRWSAEQALEAASVDEYIAGQTENTGRAVPTEEELVQMLGGGVQPPQSSQEGVGEAATGSPTNAPTTFTGRDLQDDSTQFDRDYETWTGKKLSAEIKARREAGREVELEGKTKADAVAALRADDEARGE